MWVYISGLSGSHLLKSTHIRQTASASECQDVEVGGVRIALLRGGRSRCASLSSIDTDFLFAGTIKIEKRGMLLYFEGVHLLSSTPSAHAIISLLQTLKSAAATRRPLPTKRRLRWRRQCVLEDPFLQSNESRRSATVMAGVMLAAMARAMLTAIASRRVLARFCAHWSASPTSAMSRLAFRLSRREFKSTNHVGDHQNLQGQRL